MLDPALMKDVRIPNGLILKGDVAVDGSKYATKMTLWEGRGRMNVEASVVTHTKKDGSLDMNHLAYRAKVQAHQIQVSHFLPHQELYSLQDRWKPRAWALISCPTILDSTPRQRWHSCIMASITSTTCWLLPM